MWLRVELHFSSGSPPSGLGSTGDKHAPRPHTRASGEDTRHRSQSQNPHRGHLTFGKARVSGEHAAQTIIPHFRQWCCGTTRVTKCGSAQRRRRTLPIPSMKPALHRAHPSTASFGSHIGREAVESHAWAHTQGLPRKPLHIPILKARTHCMRDACEFARRKNSNWLSCERARWACKERGLP